MVNKYLGKLTNVIIRSDKWYPGRLVNEVRKKVIPSLIFIFNPTKTWYSIIEANFLHIPTISLYDLERKKKKKTEVLYKIIGNDDSQVISLFFLLLLKNLLILTRIKRKIQFKAKLSKCSLLSL